MKLRHILKLAAKTRTLVFSRPNPKTTKFLQAVNAEFDSEVGGFKLEVLTPPQEKGLAKIYRLADDRGSSRFSWVSVHKTKGILQIDAFG